MSLYEIISIILAVIAITVACFAMTKSKITENKLNTYINNQGSMNINSDTIKQKHSGQGDNVGGDKYVK